MSLETHHVRALVAELASPAARERELAAEKVVDWLSGIDPSSAATISRALELVLTLEESEVALESQVNALCEISSHGLVPQDVIARVVSVRSWDQPWAKEYIDGLRDDLPIAPT